MALGEAGESGGAPARRRADLVARPARGRGSRPGCWSSSATRPAARTRPRVGSRRPAAGAAASTCRRRCGPSARRARRARAPGRRRAGSPGRRRSRPTARASQARRAGPRARAPRGRAARSRSGGRASPGDRRAQRPLRAQRLARACLHRRRAAGAGRRSANSRAAGVSARAPRGRPGQELARARRRRRRAPPSIAITRSAAGRQRSRRCSASTTVVPHSSLRRRSSHDQLVARHRVELRGRLVEQHAARGRPRQRGGQRDALELAAGERRRCGGRAAAGDRQRQRGLLHRPRATAAARLAAVLEREARARRAPSPITTCVSGSWKSVPHTLAQLARARARACPCPPPRRAPANSPPWKCGTRPHAARSSVDLPEPDAPGEHDELAPASSSRLDVAQRRPSALGVAVGEPARGAGRTLIARSPGARRTARARAPR